VQDREFPVPGAMNIISHLSLANLVTQLDTNQISEALEFSRFRFKLIEFLKLPFNIREPAFRDVLERTCRGVYSNYLARAERVKEILKAEDTFGGNVQVPHHPLGKMSPMSSARSNEGVCIS
jgi:hypothetical protein